MPGSDYDEQRENVTDLRQGGLDPNIGVLSIPIVGDLGSTMGLGVASTWDEISGFVY